MQWAPSWRQPGGGSGSDKFYGNAAANTFWGNAGSDQFYDSLGSDTYYGGDGSDWLHFQESIDLYDLSFADDWLSFTRAGSIDVDRAWRDIESITFNGNAYTFDQLISNLNPNPQPVSPPTATLTTPSLASSSINEGDGLAIAIATANLNEGTSLYWELSGAGIDTDDFDGLSSLTGSVAVDAEGKAEVSLAIRADASTEGNEQLGFALFTDAALTTRLAALSLTIQDTSQSPAVTNQTLWGTIGSDTITGGDGDDLISGVLASGTSASAMGAGQIDELTGKAGADVFVLGDIRGVMYDDRSSGNLGTSDYGLIKDFRTGEDKLQLRSSSYLFTTSSGNLTLYWDRNGNGSLNTGGRNRDEMIAVLEGVSTINTSDIIWA